jgi:N-methylhydantoinase A
MKKKIKIGIDVGGTFTHAVAIDISDYSVVGKACVPTTHRAKEGVARGVVDSLFKLIEENHINKEDIILIAHSTTQATNSLLEGDVAKVGIIGLGKGIERFKIKKETNLNNIELAPGKILPTCYRFIDLSEHFDDEKISKTIDELVIEGAEVIVASEAFGIEHPENELKIVEIANLRGLLATSASTISKLYGLRVRTRTAIINACMMPKMLETANMTEKAIKDTGITAPLMVMRSDGGIMNIEEMRKRPILTMLSGPAAGVAAALMYAKITDGIFLEVGGTSTDITVIKNGKPQIKTAQIGNNRLFLRTLDVRTLGIGGGSVPRFKNNRIIDVGPRSAHIADLNYTAFAEFDDFSDFELEAVQPTNGDPADYLALKLKNKGKKYTITPTSAAYLLNLVKEYGHSKGNLNAIKSCYKTLAEKWGTSAEKIATTIGRIVAQKVEPTILQLIREYKLHRNLIRFVGGGGGASAVVPFVSQHMNIPHDIAKNSEVISAIGAALGMIRDTVEKNILNPTEADLIAIRKEVINSVVKMGAVAETVEVLIEIDTKNKKVIATAQGNSELRTRDLNVKELSYDEILSVVAKSFGVESNLVENCAKNEFFYVFSINSVKKYLFGLFKVEKNQIRVVDTEGVIKLQIIDGVVKESSVAVVKQDILTIIQQLTFFGDAGALVPDIFILCGAKILDLTGLVQENQIFSLIDIELGSYLPSDKIIIIATKKS